MNHFSLTLAILLTSLPLSACSYVTAKAVRAGEPVPDGILVPTPKPVLVVSNGQASIQMIPNYSRSYAMRYGAFLAKNKTKLTFSADGYLTSTDSDLDSTNALESLERVLGTESAGDDSRKTIPNTPSNSFEIYEFVFDESGSIICLRPTINTRSDGSRTC